MENAMSMVMAPMGRPRVYPRCPRYKQHQYSPKTGRCPCGFTRPTDPRKRAAAIQETQEKRNELAAARLAQHQEELRRARPDLHPGCKWFRRHLGKTRFIMLQDGTQVSERYCPCGWDWETMTQLEPAPFDAWQHERRLEWEAERAAHKAQESPEQAAFRARMLADPV